MAPSQVNSSNAYTRGVIFVLIILLFWSLDRDLVPSLFFIFWFFTIISFSLSLVVLLKNIQLETFFSLQRFTLRFFRKEKRLEYFMLLKVQIALIPNFQNGFFFNIQVVLLSYLLSLCCI